jgi:hypothetical protein
MMFGSLATLMTLGTTTRTIQFFLKDFAKSRVFILESVFMQLNCQSAVGPYGSPEKLKGSLKRLAVLCSSQQARRLGHSMG